MCSSPPCYCPWTLLSRERRFITYAVLPCTAPTCSVCSQLPLPPGFPAAAGWPMQLPCASCGCHGSEALPVATWGPTCTAWGPAPIALGTACAAWGSARIAWDTACSKKIQFQSKVRMSTAMHTAFSSITPLTCTLLSHASHLQCSPAQLAWRKHACCNLCSCRATCAGQRVGPESLQSKATELAKCCKITVFKSLTTYSAQRHATSVNLRQQVCQ